MRLLLFCTVFTVVSIGLTAQQVPNSDFEMWTMFAGSGQYKDYEEPSDGWTSGNGAIHIAAGADPVCEKSTDARVGTYSAKITTRKIFGQIASGSLYTGRFVLNLADPVKSALRGIPFTGKPISFKGWFKYLPVAGDSGTLYATLSRWEGNQRVQVAEARITQYESQQEWMAFDIPFVYAEEGDVDTIAVVFASSAGGEFFRGSEGSTMFIDGIALNYEPMTVSEEHPDNKLRVMNNQLICDVPFARVSCFDMKGTLVANWIGSSSCNLEPLMNGIYVVVAESLDGIIHQRLVVKL